MVMDSLVDALRSSHGALDVKRSYILPVLLQERNQEVDAKGDIGYQVVISHAYVANSNSNTQGLWNRYGMNKIK